MVFSPIIVRVSLCVFMLHLQSVLGYELRKKGSPHNCLDDACAAMKLALWKIEHGVDAIIPLVSKEVSPIFYFLFFF